MNVPGDPIEHVVVLMLENHSFDQMLGALSGVYPDLDGIDVSSPRQNEDDKGNVYYQAPTSERQMLLDPRHEVEHVAIQLTANNGGFVKDFVCSFPQSTVEQRQFIMGYFPLDFLPALHALARSYTVCDRWFSSLPGPTWPNRFFALTGTSNGRVNMPEDGKHHLDLPGWFEQDQPTIFDRLSEKGIHWKVYFHDIPQTAVLMHQRRPENAARYFYIARFHEDARGLAEDFPQFTFIEPDFMGSDENDDHPPHDIMKAQKLIADVYNSIRGNPDLWRSTLLVILYDEHGGFYDHVKPPGATPPDNHQQEYNFTQLGVRVPALLVSPWVPSRVEHALFDHTSVLRYLTDKWELGALGERTKAARSIGEALRTEEPPRLDILERITMNAAQLVPPDPGLEEEAERMVVGHHLSLQALARYLRLDLVEGTPRLYSMIARLIVFATDGFKAMMGWIYADDVSLKVSMSAPDRISREFGKKQVRDDVARFLQRQKQRALPLLAKTIRDKRLSSAARGHAVRALSSITGRKFYRELDKCDKADKWLRSHGI